MSDLEKARKAKDKPASFGTDIDFDDYSIDSEDHSHVSSLKDIPEDYQEILPMCGVDPTGDSRSGSFFQLDHSVVFSDSKSKTIELMSTPDAIEKYDWLKSYTWNVVPVDMDKYTAQTELNPTNGYFIRALPGAKEIFPLQACLFIGTEGLSQNVHNIIIAEEDSELNIITGCSSSHNVRSALHLGVSEFYVKKNAKITFTMIHNWGKDMDVRPRTGIIIEDGGTFISNYICMEPLRSLQLYPTAHCTGTNSRVSFQSILYASEKTKMDVGSRAILKGKNSKTEIISRAISRDNAEIIARGHLVGESPDVKGHIECRGLILSEGSRIHAIPELEAKTQNLELSHEAAVGKIAEEEVFYLMSRGLSEDEATSMIVRGFLNVDITGLPEKLAKETKKMLKMSMEKVL
ncbi:MAG: SufD family Fe-S cluster assembly protein [Halobacteriota archaeon]|nr:SufD family Fe-S cluster assembly protein [Halobacteriota archaeon]